MQLMIVVLLTLTESHPPSGDWNTQLALALGSFEAFGFPPLPEAALKVVKEHGPSAPICLSIITSEEGM